MNAIKSIFPQRLVKSLLTAGMFCMGISACADDTAAPEKSFSIADIAELERFYDSSANKRIELPGSGYESGDIVQFIDTGISHNTYTMQYEQTGDGLLVTLPDNLASSEYGIYIVRGGMKFLYGKSYFGRFDSRRLTAGNHPRLLMDSSDFETLKAQLAVADPTSLLARMHTECMVVADAWGMSDSELAFELDASGKRILTVAREALQRIFTCAYAYRITGDTKYLEHAERDINTVCDFESWNAKRHFLDVAELSVAVGLGYDWLYHELKPETRANAERALQEYAFQPAEELGLGARAMIEEGALEGVDACFGMHVWSDYPAGTVALRKGPMMASGDQFKIHVRGKSTHGAQPQLGADALIMGAAIAQNLQTIVSRETYPGDTAVVTVGKFHSGTRFNVVAGTAELEGTTRTFSPAVRDRFEEQITRIARSTAEAMRGTADVEYLRIVPVTVNDPGMIDVVTGAAGKIFGDKGVIEADLQMGGEDFAFYQEKVPGAMVLLGVRNEACDAVWPQHHGCYKVDESVLVKGAALHVQTALDFLGVDLQ